VSGVSIHTSLNWAPAAGATSYDVYFGLSSPPPFFANTPAMPLTLPVLAASGHYYWQVVARNSCGDTAGPEWDFGTQAGEPLRQLYLPLLLRPR